MENILYFSLIPILIISSIWDIFRNKKIPNAFIVIGMITGFLYAFVKGGWGNLLLSLIVFFVMIVIGVFVLWGIMAAGDVKLLAIISIFVGLGATFKVAFLSFFIGAICFIIFDWKKFSSSLKMIVNFVFYSVPIRLYERKQSVAFSPYITIAYLVLLFI